MPFSVAETGTSVPVLRAVRVQGADGDAGKQLEKGAFEIAGRLPVVKRSLFIAACDSIVDNTNSVRPF